MPAAREPRDAQAAAPPARSRRRSLVDGLAAACCLAIACAAAGLYLQWTARERQASLQRDAEQLTAILENASTDGRAMASMRLMGQIDVPLKELLADGRAPDDPVLQDHLRTVLREQDADETHVLDRNGIVRAHLTRSGTSPDLGQDQSSHQHFKRAMTGSPNVNISVDEVTGRRLLHIAAPVRESAARNAHEIGVHAIRIDGGKLDLLLAAHATPALVVSPADVVFASNRKEWVLAPLSQAAQDELARASGTLSWAGPEPGWRLVVLQPSFTWADAMAATSIASALLLLTALSYYVVSRRNYIQQQRERQREAGNAHLRALREMAQASSTQLREMSDTLPCAVFRLELNTHEVPRFVFVGRPVADVLGISAEEQQADYRSHWRHVVPEDLPRVKGAFAHATQTFEPMAIDYRVDWGGRVRWIRLVATGTARPEGATWTGYCIDVSEQMANQRSLQAAKEAAEAATVAKSAFLANMSHEIRTPMNAIIGLAHLALRTELDPQQRDYVQKVHGAGQALLGILNDILDFSKIEAGRLDVEAIDFDLDDTLARVTTLTGAKAADKELELLFEVPADLPRRLRSDPLRLSQVLTNLINNAIKFTERGQILVRCRHHAAADGGIELAFSVHDTGIGMTPEQTARLFTPFSQADESTTRRFGGTGLGLSISRRLVETVGGSIGVDSTPGLGSVFSFTWPCREAQSRPAPRVLPQALRGLRVLVVDDNAAAREILGNALAPFGFELDMVASGAEAVAAVGARVHRPYDLVFTDWKMPGMDGIALARELKQPHAGTPAPAVVLVTAFGRDELRQQAAQAGIDGFLQKPINQSMLVDTLVGLYADAPATQASDPGPGHDTPRLDGLQVLLVEDNEINQQIACELMRAAGVAVAVADNGRIAVDMLRNAAPGTYHLVLMDLQMPEMDGHQATLALRAERRFDGLPIVAMTAHAMVEERERCLAEGMDDHMTKPVDPTLLFGKLRQWGGRHLHAAPRTQPVAGTDPGPPAAGLQPPAAPLQSPPLPMLDTAAALRRVLGNHKLYRELLTRYRDEQAGTPGRLRAFVQQGDATTAQRLAHTLKGVSGNIGAAQVEDAAARLEHGLRSGATEQFADDIAQLEQLLAPALLAISSWIAATEPPAVPGVAAAAVATTADRKTLRADLHRLADLLADMDGGAQDLLDTLRPSLAHVVDASTLHALSKHVAQFDFDEALLLLRGLAWWQTDDAEAADALADVPDQGSSRA